VTIRQTLERAGASAAVTEVVRLLGPELPGFIGALASDYDVVMRE
jgi:hypothetical protein